MHPEKWMDPEQGKEPNLSLDDIVNALIVAIENLDTEEKL